MFSRRVLLLMGITISVTLVLSGGLAWAQDSQPPVQPAGVDAQVDTLLWDQLGTPVGGDILDGMASSYYDSVSLSGLKWSVAADDFRATGNPTHTAWFVTKVVLRSYADLAPLDPGDKERAKICFYSGTASPPLGAPYPWNSGNCRDNLVPTGYVTEGTDQYVVTYTVSSVFLLTGSPYWVSVQMWPTQNKLPGATFYWYWRARSETTVPDGGAFSPFAYSRSGNFYPDVFNTSCQDVWQVQTGSCSKYPTQWPDGRDLSFQLLGSYYDGALSSVYLPLVRK